MQQQPTLFDRLGGEQGMTKLVDALYGKVFADPILAPYFNTANAEHLYGRQVEFFTTTLGGPRTYSGLAMYEAHGHRGIQREHFARFLEHLVAVLKEWQVSDETIREVMMC